MPPWGATDFLYMPRRSQRNAIWRGGHLLGRHPDADTGHRLQRSAQNVCYRRQQVGIPPFVAPPDRFRWTPASDALLGTMSDREVARQLCVPITSVRQRQRCLGVPALPAAGQTRWTARMDAWLGRHQDAHVARYLRVAMTSVRNRRKRLQIPAWSARRRLRWSSRMDDLLGVVPDTEVAIMLNLPVATEVARRERVVQA